MSSQPLPRKIVVAIREAKARFIAWSSDLDRRNRAGELGKWPWQDEPGGWPWKRRPKK